MPNNYTSPNCPYKDGQSKKSETEMCELKLIFLGRGIKTRVYFFLKNFIYLGILLKGIILEYQKSYENSY